MSAQHTPKRICDVRTALSARRLAHQFRRQGLDQFAAQAWAVVRAHLNAKAVQS